ncbi:MAG: hypothetical protein ACTSRW_15570 [Candidatus Helarchaeota archaeon]
MDLVDFDWAIKNMRKEKILRLKQILFELYAFERTKYEMSKLLKITAQSIGPEIDLLEGLKLIRRTRTVEKYHIPSTYYKMDIDNVIDKLEFLSGDKKNLLSELLERFQPIYALLKKLENEHVIELDVEKFHQGIIPTDLEMLLLQIISSLFILFIIIHDVDFYAAFGPKFLDRNSLLLKNLEDYGTELKLKLPPPEKEMVGWIESNSERITGLFEAIWMQLLQKIIFASMVNEPLQSLSVIESAKQSKRLNLQKVVKSNRRPVNKKTKSKDMIDDDTRMKNTVLKRVQAIIDKITMIQSEIENKRMSRKINSMLTRIGFIIDKIRNAPLGLLNKSEKEKREVLSIKIAILTTLSDYLNDFFDTLQDLEQNIGLETEKSLKIMMNVFNLIPAIEDLTAWYEDPTEFTKKPAKRRRIKGKELESYLSSFISKLSMRTSIVEVKEFIHLFFDEYSEIAAEFKFLKKILDKFRKNGLILGLEKYQHGGNDVEIIRLKPTTDDGKLILKLASNSPELKISLKEIQQKLDFTPIRARVVIEDLKKEFDVREDPSSIESEVWYFPGLKEK